MALLAVMGAEPPAPGGRADSREVLRQLCYEEASPSSIVAALGGAREAARRARETVSMEMWESINTTWNSARGGRLQRMRPANMFRFVRERCAVINGIADGTMSRDEGWHFLVLGQSLERVDMTARLLSSATVISGTQAAWVNVLRGSGAHHAFVRTYGGNTSDRQAAEFILLDRLFPRSLVSSLAAAEKALARLDRRERRVGFETDAERLLGTARASLEYRRPSEILDDLPGRMTDLQRTCNQVSLALTQRYFEAATAAQWHGGGEQ